MTRSDAARCDFFRAVIRACRRDTPDKIVDSTGASLSGRDLLIRALAARRVFRRLLAADERFVGVLLPPSGGAAIANLALALDRRVMINLNYTSSETLLNQQIASAGVRHVITSRRVLERFPLALNAEIVVLEDLPKHVSLPDKLIAAVQGRVVPAALLLRWLKLDRLRADDLMMVLFTSGTTGEPKGVMLGYGSIQSNLAAADEILHWNSRDVLLGVLPFFHAFGSTFILWGPLTRDLRAVYIANPLDARVVGDLCRKHGATIVAATPILLRTWLRRGDPQNFASLELVAIGAERLPPELIEEWDRALGVRPFEGYGATEMGPLVACNIAPARAVGDPALGARPGTVGKPTTGVETRLVDPDTRDPLPGAGSGLLEARGPHLMLGYLGDPAATVAVMDGEWYVTGDIATIDADGFITLEDRLSRFSKIGGEKIPHALVETVLAPLLGGHEEATPVVAVTALPDAARGERLVVVHTPTAKTPDELRQGLIDAGLPPLFLPARDQFVTVEAIPLTGLGKVDLKRVKDLARQHTETAAQIAPRR